MKLLNLRLRGALLALTLLAFITVSAQDVLHLNSPDKQLDFQLTIRSGQAFYKITNHQAILIDWSALGFDLENRPGAAAASLKLQENKKVKNTYPVRGNHDKAYDKSQVYLVDVKGAGQLLYQLAVKVADNGVAFSYIFLKDQFPVTVTGDKTNFVLPAGSTIWSQPDIHAYEGKYSKAAIDTVKPGLKVGPPLTVRLPHDIGYLAITEGGLVNYAGMSLVSNAPRSFETVLAGPVHIVDNRSRAWRIIEFGKDLNALVNNDLITDVSRPYDKALFPKGNQTDWIKPGKSVWSWLSGNRSVTMDNMKRFVDWASELGIPYNLVDEGWGKWNEAGKTKWELIRQLVDYASPKNVGIWVWKAYPDRNSIPGLKKAAAREAFFKQCHEAGVVGVKIDFFDGESQEIIQFYEDALKDAAKYHIMVDFHGADKPTGLSRTYPNELSREAVRGLESKADWPVHNTTLPFTRYLAGHGDYTPLSFRDIVKGTTLSHQVATVALLNSAFMCLAVNPETLLTSNVLPMVKAIPVSWDETIVLPQSEIGDLVVFARKKGKDWFLCVLNGRKVKRTLNISLDFLGNKPYKLAMLKDDLADPSKAVNAETRIKKSAPLNIELAPGGGFMGHFVEQ